jgi:hypothetical protein
MTATTALDHTTQATARLARTRALSVAGATLATVGVWVVAVPLLGAHLIVRFGAGGPQTVGIDLVVGASLMASLCAWGLLALLERRTARARTIWTIWRLPFCLCRWASRSRPGSRYQPKSPSRSCTWQPPWSSSLRCAAAHPRNETRPAQRSQARRSASTRIVRKKAQRETGQAVASWATFAG